MTNQATATLNNSKTIKEVINNSEGMCVKQDFDADFDIKTFVFADGSFIRVINASNIFARFETGTVTVY